MILKFLRWQLLFLFCLLIQPVFAANSIPTKPLKLDEIPGMRLLVNTMHSMPIYKGEKASFINAILPAEKRTYYRGEDDFLPPNQRQRLIKKYAAILKVPESNIVLFAVTDPKIGRTVLFPNFFKLKSEMAQAALLFHESAWLIGTAGHQTYKKVVSAEVALQNYLKNPNDGEAYYDFYDRMSQLISYKNLELGVYDPGPTELRYLHIIMPAALAFDRTHNPALFNNPDKTSISFKKIVGEDYLKLVLDKVSPVTALESFRSYTLADQPTSLFMKALAAITDMKISSGWIGYQAKSPAPLAQTQQAANYMNELNLRLPEIHKFDRILFPVEWHSQKVGVFSINIMCSCDPDMIIKIP